MIFIASSVAFFLIGSQAQTLSSVLAETPSLSNFRTILSKYPTVTSLLSTTSNVTIFAPIDGARGLKQFLNFPEDNLLARTIPGIVESGLTYHVLKGVYPASAIPKTAFVETLLTNANFSSVKGGQRVRVNREDSGRVFLAAGINSRVNVTQKDIKFDGGLIHLVDGVLVPPQSVTITSVGLGLANFWTSLYSAGLLPDFDTRSDITIFAPANTAFASSRTMASLTKDQLSGLLKSHVASGVSYTSSLKDGQIVQNMQGRDLKVRIDGGNILINNAKIKEANILTKNGVIHIIDNVLIPE